MRDETDADLRNAIRSLALALRELHPNALMTDEANAFIAEAEILADGGIETNAEQLRVYRVPMWVDVIADSDDAASKIADRAAAEISTTHHVLEVFVGSGPKQEPYEVRDLDDDEREY